MNEKVKAVVTYNTNVWYDVITEVPAAPYGYRLEVMTDHFTGFIEKFRFVREPEKPEYTATQVRKVIKDVMHLCADIVEKQGHSLHYEIRALTQDRKTINTLIARLNEDSKN